MEIYWIQFLAKISGHRQDTELYVKISVKYERQHKAFVRKIQQSRLPSQMPHVKSEDCMELMGCSLRTKGGYTTFLGLLKRQQGSKDI